MRARWDVIKGNERFFVVTKKFHNGLHGVPVDISDEELDLFIAVNRENAASMEFADIVFVHDPQPIVLVEQRGTWGGHWLWRCHIDSSQPKERVWTFLERYIQQYDRAVFSAPAFAAKLSIPQELISPSIDPLADKNRDLAPEAVDAVFERFGIDRTRPIVT